MYGFSLFLLYLALYSFLGWIAEVLYVFAQTQKLTNRGFLTGPFLPIYGIGAIALVLLIEPYVKNPFLVFVASVLVTSAIEYVGSLILDKMFHISLWDYHGRRFNLNGRICLQNSLGFGALGLLLIYVIHPFANTLLNGLPQAAAIAVAWALFGIILVDAANSITSLARVRPVVDELKGGLGQVHAKIEERAVASEKAREQRRSAGRTAHINTIGRLAKAFPHARSVDAPKPVPGPESAS